ncbi:hypothetical protein FB451DRAFT_1180894 [Mycena latifolia]|nr:hypothetical protein FB451DRAFT_1180894 [Mycena latifolia]
MQYTLTVLFNGVATCKCPDFCKHGGVCKHLQAALILLNWLRYQGTKIPLIPIPASVEEAYRLETSITPPPAPTALHEPRELPTVRAATAIEDLLRNDDSCHDGPSPDDDADPDGSDDESVASNTSSDSEDEVDESGSMPHSAEKPSPSNNRKALGEQALARTMFELEEMGSKFNDLAEFLKNAQGPLTGSARDALIERCGPLTAFMAEVHRLSSGEDHLPSVSFTAPVVPPPSGTQRRSTQALKRKAHLLGASPEKASSRHQSFAPH